MHSDLYFFAFERQPLTNTSVCSVVWLGQSTAAAALHLKFLYTCIITNPYSENKSKIIVGTIGREGYRLFRVPFFVIVVIVVLSVVSFVVVLLLPVFLHAFNSN